MNEQQREAIEKEFLNHKENLKRHHTTLTRMAAVNQWMKQFSWAFVHPYTVNAQIFYLEGLQQEGRGDKNDVFRIFAMNFFNLKNTTYLIESLLKKRAELAPFCPLIDQSVFMCLQRDYAGAISALLPVIEGSLRHYLTNKKGMTHGKIMKTSTLLSVFPDLKASYLAHQTEFYRKGYTEHVNSSVTFNEDQVKELVAGEEATVDIWIAIITEYLEKNLYLDTRSPDFSDGLNRHVIFHAFTADIYYNLENYLRIFNCVIFLGYIFALGDGGDLLFKEEDEDIMEKWIAFEQIRLVSWGTRDIKVKAYSGYSDFDAKRYSEDLFEDPLFKQFKQMPAISLEHRLLHVDELIRSGVSKDKAARKRGRA